MLEEDDPNSSQSTLTKTSRRIEQEIKVLSETENQIF